MNYKAYLAEALGTFALTFVVWLSVAFAMPFPTPVMAASTLGLFVYLVGGISGTHINPAITIALLTIRKIKPIDAFWYVVSQLIGATIAMFLGMTLSGETAVVPHDDFLTAGVAEALGAFFLAFAVTSVVLRKVEPLAAGAVIGGSLFIGIFMAFPFSNGILNPAVALGVGSLSLMYLVGPIVGAIGGAWAAKGLHREA